MSQLAREFFKFRRQTICVEVIIAIINSQITKARDIGHINLNLFNSFTTMWPHNFMFEKRKIEIISKLVGISEAIRLILIFLNLQFGGLNLSSLQVLVGQSVFSLYTSKETPGLFYSPSLMPEQSIHCKSTLDPDCLKFNE